jgi:hypothetical protein
MLLNILKKEPQDCLETKVKIEIEIITEAMEQLKKDKITLQDYFKILSDSEQKIKKIKNNNSTKTIEESINYIFCLN